MVRVPFASLIFLLLGIISRTYGDAESDAMAEMFGGQQFGRGKDKKAAAVKADIPYIRCGTCEAIVKILMKRAAEKGEKVISFDLMCSRSIQYMQQFAYCVM
jgi:hypothetical protein